MPIHPLNKQMTKLFGVESDCICHRCITEKSLTGFEGWPLSSSIMILCEICGNKRCPHAEDHDFKCTGSNESNQIGTVG